MIFQAPSSGPLISAGLWQLLQLGHDASTNEKGDRVAMFRTAAISFAAAYGRDYPHLASAVLGHIDPRVTEEHYNRASSVSANEIYVEILSSFLGD